MNREVLSGKQEKMASYCGRRLFQRSTASARAFLCRSGRTQSTASVASGPSSLGVGGLAPSNLSPASRLSRNRNRNPFSGTRLPVELGCGESLMPLHSATASALLKSMLSSKVGHWGCLSEGFATPL